MKRVDENYSYDELEGFAPLEIKGKASKDEIWLSAYKRAIHLSAAARKICAVKGYLLAAYNSERRQLLLAACGAPGDGVMKLPATVDHGIHCTGLTELLVRECRFDLSVVNIHVYGEVCRSRKGAVIFDLNSAVSSKPETRRIKG